MNRITNESILNIEQLVDFRIDLTRSHVNRNQECIEEAHQFYDWSMKKSIMDYVLKDKDEQKRLGVKMKHKVTFYFITVFKFYLK